MNGQNVYILGNKTVEHERLIKQSEQLEAESSFLFEQIPLPDAPKILEIGCGPRGCIPLLSQFAGENGKVIALEKNPASSKMAESYVHTHGIKNVSVINIDGSCTGFERNSFDLVTSRLILVNIPNPENIIDESVSLTKPGGWVAFHEADYHSHLCYPPHPAWDHLMNLFIEYSTMLNIDPFIGRKIENLLRKHENIIDIHVNPIVHVYPQGHERRRIFLSFIENISDGLIDNDMIAPHELFQLLNELEQHIDRPDTIIVSHLFFQVWGRKCSPC